MIPKTAAALTPADILRYRDHLKARKFSIAEQTQLRLERAKKVAMQAAALLREEFLAERVVVFGSLVTPDLFHTRSDIDLAAWGMKGRDYYRAVGVLQAIDPEFSIDLILFEEASTELQVAIQNDGVSL